MKCCQLSAYLHLAMLAALSQPIALIADEPLSVKIELRSGINGPKRSAVAVPGEYIFMTVRLSGDSLAAANELTLEVRGEIRSETGELLKATEKRQWSQEKVIGTRQVAFNGGLPVPPEYDGKAIKHLLFIRDVKTGVEVKDELLLTIHSPKTLHVFNPGYYLPNHRDVPASGRFAIGDKVRLGFNVGQIKDSKFVECKLEFIPTDKSKQLGELSESFEIPKSKRDDNRLALRFDFPADEPFEGKVRLTVVDDLKNSHSVELPLSITDALSAEESAYVAERAKDEAKPTKKE
jgi:hypothetical protein